MPISLVRVRENMFDRICSHDCYLCKLPMNAKVNDMIAIKKTRKSRYAHVKCAVKHNWLDKKEIEKDYLVPIPSKT